MKETYITEDEQLKCQKVANALTELYDYFLLGTL